MDTLYLYVIKIFNNLLNSLIFDIYKFMTNHGLGLNNSTKGC